MAGAPINELEKKKKKKAVKQNSRQMGLKHKKKKKKKHTTHNTHLVQLRKQNAFLNTDNIYHNKISLNTWLTIMKDE